MKHFQQGLKYNFVDKNNVVVGFDNDQNCCEEFGYTIMHHKPVEPWVPSPAEDMNDGDFDLEPYNIDPTFFHECGYEGRKEPGMAVCFRLYADGLPDLFLVLYNAHNGYYSHGFTVSVGGLEQRAGKI